MSLPRSLLVSFPWYPLCSVLVLSWVRVGCLVPLVGFLGCPIVYVVLELAPGVVCGIGGCHRVSDCKSPWGWSVVMLGWFLVYLLSCLLDDLDLCVILF